MKRTLTVFVAPPLIFGLLAFALSVQSFADEKSGVKDVKFACSHHGPMNMMLTLSFEKGDPRKIEIAGKNNGRKWFVTIAGDSAAEGNGGKNGDSVKVHSGDTITWIITDANHGVAFADQELAEAMLTFDQPGDAATGPLKLEDLTTTLTSDDWKKFGPKLWGTKPIDAVSEKTITMVSCKVK
jgi:plastocyanin